jgi:hypothetical protein
MSRILRLSLLAPDIVEAIPDGRTNQALILEKLAHRALHPDDRGGRGDLELSGVVPRHEELRDWPAGSKARA